jgi:hypothetical protein
VELLLPKVPPSGDPPEAKKYYKYLLFKQNIIFVAKIVVVWAFSPTNMNIGLKHNFLTCFAKLTTVS